MLVGAGEYVVAAMALGEIPADVAMASSLSDFRELVLWFHVLPGDSMDVAHSKVCRTVWVHLYFSGHGWHVRYRTLTQPQA